ncbi:ATP-binding protein [Jeotgalibacillus marinus]|uniref:histidine kinase n=1 Tax=Jeotgalibacillus marinus TaxID=86667 RepID=A0ABV3Q4X0_9BACL
MRIKYLYQLLASHLGTLLIAFLILGFLFSQYVESFIYKGKVEEMTTYAEELIEGMGEDIVHGDRMLINYYKKIFTSQDVHFFIFDQQTEVTYPRLNKKSHALLRESEWEQIKRGESVVIKRGPSVVANQDPEAEVSIVAIPKMNEEDVLVGGVLLTWPITGTEEMITEIFQFLLSSAGIALVITIFLSVFLSKVHVNRIQRFRNATTQISSGNYDVKVDDTGRDEFGELADDFNEMVKQLKLSNDEIDRLEKRRRQFIADVSHELRTPLTTIKGVVEGLNNEMIAEEEKEKGLLLISKETRRLIRLVNENLDYEKIRSNQVSIQKQWIDLYEIFEVIQEHLSIQAEEKGNKIVLYMEEELMVFADYDRLMQILINIVKNSIQFTENGSISLRGKKGYKEIIIEVEDTGIGVKKEDIESIWERFYKADLSRTSDLYGKFGLGLSIVKQLVQLHQGTIHVSSKENQGTIFEIHLPDQDKGKWQ